MIIFDLDGTLANCEHRRHFVQPYEKKWVEEEIYFGPEFKGQSGNHWFNKDGTIWNGKKDWRAFYYACDKDEPIEPVINNLRRHSQHTNVQIWSGRCESVREKTIEWFDKHISCFAPRKWFDENLKMRPIGDNTPDDQLKERWLDDQLAGGGQQIDFVFDDRPKVVRMFRRRGIFVFDCNQDGGEF